MPLLSTKRKLPWLWMISSSCHREIAKGTRANVQGEPRTKTETWMVLREIMIPLKRSLTGTHFLELDSLSYNFQGAVAKRRSNFKGNQFPVATNVARKAATVPPLSVRSRAFKAGRKTSAKQSRSRVLAPPVQNRSLDARCIATRHEVEQKVENGGGKWTTLDSRFAIMKEQRNSNNNNSGVKVHSPRLPPWARARRF